MPDNNTVGWGAYERLVLAKLDELGQDIKDLRTEVAEEVKDLRTEQVRQKVDIAMLNVKSGLWGLAGGGIIVAGLIGYSILGIG